jgi:hypothetical protein
MHRLPKHTTPWPPLDLIMYYMFNYVCVHTLLNIYTFNVYVYVCICIYVYIHIECICVSRRTTPRPPPRAVHRKFTVAWWRRCAFIVPFFLFFFSHSGMVEEVCIYFSLHFFPLFLTVAWPRRYAYICTYMHIHVIFVYACVYVYTYVYVYIYIYAQLVKARASVTALRQHNSDLQKALEACGGGGVSPFKASPSRGTPHRTATLDAIQVYIKKNYTT